MNIFSKQFTYTFLLLNLIAQMVIGKEIFIQLPAGEGFEMEFNLEDSFRDILQQLEDVLQIPLEQQEIFVLANGIDSEMYASSYDTSKKSKKSKRIYENPLKHHEEKSIRYIVKTLGFDSLLKIGTATFDIEKAGKEVRNVHPLRFLMCIFTDEESKVAIHNITNRGWIWDKFMAGLEKSCEEESKNGNMKAEYVTDFSKNVGIDATEIAPYVNSRQWTALVQTLITKIPRSGNPAQYNKM